MKGKRKNLRLLCIVLTVVFLLSGCTSESNSGTNESGDGASEYPNKAIELVVPTAAGGTTDLIARLFAKYAKDLYGASIVIVNISGSGGYNGSNEVYQAAPDGYKAMFFQNGLLTNYVSGISDYNHEGFKIGPSIALDSTAGFVVNANSDIKTIQDLIKKAKENPGQIKAATEYGGYTYFMLLKFQAENDVEFNLVDVGSNSEKATALLGGHIDMVPSMYASVKAYIESGDFLALGIPTEERQETAPGIPTFKEQGVDFLNEPYVFGFFLPNDTPQEVIDYFDKIAEEICQNPEFEEDLKNLGATAEYKKSADHQTKLDDLVKIYQEQAASAGE